MTLRLVWLFIFTLGLAACGSGGGSGGGPGGAAPVVTTASVESVAWTDRIGALGTARASESIAITSKLSERVARVRFESGQRVEVGQVLVDLDVGGDVADLESARTTLREAQRQFERQRQLAEKQLISTSQFDSQRTARDAAEAQVKQSMARVSDRVIVAPFAGVLGLREVSPGQLLGPGSTITTLDAIDAMEVDFAIPEVQLSLVRDGLTVEARSDAWPGKVFAGRVVSVDSRVDVATRSITVRAVVDNAEGKLLPGMLLSISILQPERQAVVVPEIAVQQNGSTSFVYRVAAENTVEAATVMLGARDSGRVEVREGLSVGDRIVIDGTVKLRPGSSFREAAPPAAEATALEGNTPSARG